MMTLYITRRLVQNPALPGAETSVFIAAEFMFKKGY